MLSLYTNGGFLAFPRCLPESNVVQQLVYMGVKALFALSGAPDFDALLGKPLHNEGRFIFASTEAVKHENQQDVELMSYGPLLDFHDGITGIGADLVAGDALFGNFIDDLPIRVG